MPAPLVKIDLEFPYTRSVGPVIGAYLDGLEAGRLLASRAGDRTLSPPLEYDPATGASVEPELVEVGPEGVVTSWTWVDTPNPNHPLDRPFAFALIQLDGADTAMVHVVDGPRDAHQHRHAGAAAVARRAHRLRDRHRVLRGASVSPDAAAKEGPRIMPFPVALHYESPAAPRSPATPRRCSTGKIIGQQCTGECGLVYVPPKDFCPIDVIKLTTEDDVELGARGTVINYTVITPVQYPGQTETEPFARVSIAARRHRRDARLQELLDTPGRRRARRHAGRRGVAPGGGAQTTTSRPAAGAAPTAASRAGCRPANPTRDRARARRNRIY